MLSSALSVGADGGGAVDVEGGAVDVVAGVDFGRVDVGGVVAGVVGGRGAGGDAERQGGGGGEDDLLHNILSLGE